MDQNYFKMAVSDNLYLVFPEIRFAKTLFELLDSDRDHIRPFLNFVDHVADYTDEESYLKLKLQGFIKQTDALFFIAIDDTLIGTADFHNMDYSNKTAEIGYWLHSKYVNQNITTRIVHKLCEYAFINLELNRLTIVADTDNIASNKVALKNGFTLEGTAVEEVLLYDEMRNMNHYALLKQTFLINETGIN